MGRPSSYIQAAPSYHSLSPQANLLKMRKAIAASSLAAGPAAGTAVTSCTVEQLLRDELARAMHSPASVDGASPASPSITRGKLAPSKKRLAGSAALGDPSAAVALLWMRCGAAIDAAASTRSDRAFSLRAPTPPQAPCLPGCLPHHTQLSRPDARGLTKTLL